MKNKACTICGYVIHRDGCIVKDVLDYFYEAWDRIASKGGNK